MFARGFGSVQNCEPLELVSQILNAVDQAGGPYYEWHVATTFDAEEAVARYRRYMLSAGLVLVNPTSSCEVAVRVKQFLKERAFQSHLDMGSGSVVFCFRMNWCLTDLLHSGR